MRFNKEKAKFEVQKKNMLVPKPNFALPKEKPKRKFKISLPVLFIVGFLVIFTLILALNFQIAYSVTINDQYVGIVTTKSSLNSTINDIETVTNTASDGTSTPLQSATKPIIIKKGTETEDFDLRQNILAICPNVEKAYAIYVNNALVCACSTESDAFDALNGVKEQYDTGTLLSINFLDDVATRNEYVPSNQVESITDAVKMLNGQTSHREVYTPTADEELANIAQRFSMTLDELSGMNQNLSDIVPAGTQVNVLNTQANIRVQTTAIETYTKAISYGTDEENDNNLPIGSRVLASSGQTGSEIEKATVTYINGIEQNRQPISDTVTSQPVNEVYKIGTLNNGQASIVSSALFIWPAVAVITSPFSLSRVNPVTGKVEPHPGIDIGATYGTNVLAAASGTVTLAAWDSGYGNCIRIKSADPYSEVYGHLSEFDVKEGQQVTQGQTIGKVGATGEATGPHLHFEIRVNNNPVDPITLLPVKK